MPACDRCGWTSARRSAVDPTAGYLLRSSILITDPGHPTDGMFRDGWLCLDCIREMITR